MTREDLRRAVLEAIERHVGADRALTTTNIRQEVLTVHRPQGPDEERLLLSCLHDLFRIGYLAVGRDLNNPDPPWCHVTELGRHAIAQASRDPANPEGYLAHLRGIGTLQPIAESYIAEALST